MNTFFIGELFAVGVSACDACCCSILNNLEKRLSLFTVTFSKIIFAFLFLVVLRWIKSGSVAFPEIPLPAMVLIIISGMIGFIFADMFFFGSFLRLPYRLGMIIYYANPIVTTFYAYFFYQQHITLQQMLGIVLTIGGAVIAVSANGKDDSSADRRRKLVGVLFAFLGMLGQASSVLLSSRALDIIGDLEDKTIICSQMRQLAAIGGFIILGIIRHEWSRFRQDMRQPHAISQLAISGITGCAIGTTLLLEAIQYIPIGIATAMGSISPILVIPVSVFIFKDKVHLSEIAGILVTVSGIVLLSIS